MSIDLARVRTPFCSTSFLTRLTLLAGAAIAGCSANAPTPVANSPCASLFYGPNFTSRQSNKTLVFGGQNCYVASGYGSVMQARRQALHQCQREHRDCRVVAENNQYIGVARSYPSPRQTTATNSGIDFATALSTAAILGSAGLSIAAARNGHAVPSIVTPTASTRSHRGQCPPGWRPVQHYGPACDCGATTRMGASFAWKHFHRIGKVPCTQ